MQLPDDRESGWSARRGGVVPSARGAFSLVELMIVVVILGAVVSIVIPMFSYSEKQAKSDAVLAEMRAVQEAFIDYYSDNMPDRAALEEFASYGLSALCVRALNGSPPIEFQATGVVRWPYDAANRLGWRGPYLMQEGTVEVDVGSDGQKSAGNGGTRMSIPVVKDPDGGHYRVLLADGNQGKLSLLYTGRSNRAGDLSLDLLDTGISDTNGFGWIEAQYDDIAVRLTPFRSMDFE
jgi:prepilin-type N-terminal cleavage/methylation domain-containing protein